MNKKCTPSCRHRDTFGSRCLALFVMLFLATTVSNAQVEVVKDLNKWADPNLNDFNTLHAHGNGAFFHAKGTLYFTDGSASGTIPLQNFNWFYGGKSFNGYFYYTPSPNGQLWRSDGTVAGTGIFKNINPSIEYVNSPRNFTEVNGILYFAAGDAAKGVELWRTDGTQAGTYIVKDIKAGAASSNPSNLTAVGNKLFFSAPSGNNKGIELWVSDGTLAGTMMVYDINYGSNSSDPANLIDVNGVCFFTAKDPTHGKELWRSDGTAAGTWLVKDIRPGSGGTISKLAAVNGWAFFEAHDGVHGKELWKSDGTEANTMLVKDVYPGPGGSSGMYVADDIFSFNGIYYFVSYYNGHALWRSDGTAAGTYPITLPNGPDFSFVDLDFTVFNNKLYFFTQVNWDYVQLFSTDGTIGGTVMINDRFAYFNYGSPAKIEAAGSTLFMIAQEFRGEDGFTPPKIRKSDGTATGIVDVFSIPGPSLGSMPISFTPITGGNVVFTATQGDYDQNNLYRTDGTTAGTVEIKKFREPYNLTSFNGKVLFSAYEDYNAGSFLWITDGTPAGTQNITPPGRNFTLRSSTPLGSALVIGVDQGNSGSLWKTNGTQAGTILLKDFPGSTYYGSSSMATLQNKVLFTAPTSSSDNYYELWITDGTPAGTQILKDVNPTGGSFPQNLTTVGNVIVFTANDGSGTELFKTDGTAAGTSLLKDFSTTHSQFEDFTVFNGKAFFVVAPNGTERQLWSTDGTSSGTTLVKDFFVGNETIDILGQRGSELIVMVTTTESEIWKTDGTPAGTMLVKNLGTSLTRAADVTVLNNVLYFGGINDDGGLWQTDGTDCGTHQIESVGGLTVREMISVGTKIIFNGSINEEPYLSFLGAELYGYIPEAPTPCVAIAARASQQTTPEEEVRSTDLISSYPNPFQGEMAVEIKGETNAQFVLEVFALNGRSIQTASGLSFNTTYHFGSQWMQGVYVLKANVNGKIITRKVVKVN